MYRTIAIGGGATLEELHIAIQDAYVFNDDHLYSFFTNLAQWSGEGYGAPFAALPPFADQVQLAELNLCEGRKFNYLFNFSDNWQFFLLVTKLIRSLLH